MCNIYIYFYIIYTYFYWGESGRISEKNICISRYHVAHLHHLTFSWSRWDGLWEGPGHNVASVARQTQVTDAREDSIQFAGNLKFCGQTCCRDFSRLSEKLPSITYGIAWTPQSNATSCCFNQLCWFSAYVLGNDMEYFQVRCTFHWQPGQPGKIHPRIEIQSFLLFHHSFVYDCFCEY